MVSPFNIMKTAGAISPLLFLIGPVIAYADNEEGRELRGILHRSNHKKVDLPTVGAIWDGGVIEASRRRGHIDFPTTDESGFVIKYDPDEPPLIFETLKQTDFDDDPYTTWTGFDADTGSEIIFTKGVSTTGVETLTGTLFVEDGPTCQFRKIGEGEIIIDRVDEFPPEEDDDGEESEEEETETDGRALVQVPIPEPRKLGEIYEIDVMVVTTMEARCEAAGRPDGCSTKDHAAVIEGIIHQAIAETNDAYTRSKIHARMRLVHVEHDPNYREKSQFQPMLTELRIDGDGSLDYVHGLRDKHGADFVVLMTRSLGWSCGLGVVGNMRASSAFSVVAYSCATGNLSFAHETAHNMGVHHDRQASGAVSAVVDGFYYYGYQHGAGIFRTIMATDCSKKSCPRRPVFANPKVKWEHGGRGYVTGNRKCNVAKWINENLSTFAGYRTKKTGNALTAAPTATPVGTGMVGVFTNKKMYEVGEDIEITFTYGKDKKVTPMDLLGIFEQSTYPASNLRSYQFTCGSHQTACDQGTMRVSQGFTAYSGSQWPNLKPGTYVIGLEAEATISKDIHVSEPFQVVAAMPSAGDLAACENNDDFRFETTGKLIKGCDYINMDWKINEYCTDPFVTHNCPKACKFCDHDNLICGDDENFRFTSTTGESLRCQWINFDWKRDEYCHEDFDGGAVLNACKAACNICTTT